MYRILSGEAAPPQANYKRVTRDSILSSFKRHVDTHVLAHTPLTATEHSQESSDDDLYLYDDNDVFLSAVPQQQSIVVQTA
uniref:Uncharacterized protein n=1 Tax=Hyaloperonospora arabidopsidis (strain Emoy2) TaxID=559515 RepID=M4BTW8_HYAAE